MPVDQSPGNVKSSLGLLPSIVGSAYLPTLVAPLLLSTTTNAPFGVVTSGIHVALFVNVVLFVAASYVPAASVV